MWSVSLVALTNLSSGECAPVLAPWNPHLLLLALCCVHCIVCLWRIEYGHVQQESNHNVADVAPPPPSHLYANFRMGPHHAAVVSALLLGACAAVQCAFGGVHLVHYPTLLTLATLAGSTIRYLMVAPRMPDLAWSLGFHMQTVAIPVLVLAIVLFGSREWTDALTHLAFLAAAAHLLYIALLLQQRQSPSSADECVGLVRTLALSLGALSFYDAQIQFGPFDSWRYALTLLPAAALATPFVAIAVMGNADADQVHCVSLRCTTVALACMVLTLAQFG
jgi:hypothetical protein